MHDSGLPPEAALFVRKAAAMAPPAPLAQLALLSFAPPLRKPRSTPSKRVIVIDPGHGGSDPGAISAPAVYEKTLTLKAARLVQKELLRLGRYIVVLTRNSDQSIPLRDRVAFARAADADLFISLHADAHPDPAVRGASVYTLSKKASDAEAAALAERENKADLISGVDLSHEAPEVANILIDLAQRETMNRSAGLAKLLVRHLGKRTTLVRNTHRFAGFAVLKAPDVPAVLVELGYTSNLQDRRMLQEESYLRKLATAIAEAVDAYLTLEEARR
jgi:N-acetylmuramoyl-L-alanine amidase